MRRVEVSENTSDKLVSLPETGMGFQLVSGDVNNQERYFAIFNASEGFEFEDEEELRVWLNQPKFAGESGDSTMIGISGIRLLATRIQDSESEGSASTTGTPLAPPATLVTTITANGKRIFYRFSAFNPDKRFNATTGDLAPGTYTTTDNDQTVIPSGLAAVGRLALPNTAPAIYVHECTPKSGTTILAGTVAPAFGQAGGGVEALFAAGASSVNPPKFTTRPEN